MGRKVLMIFFALITVMTSFVYAKSQDIEVPEEIRIGLYYGEGSKSIEILKLSSPGGIEIGVMVDGEFEYINEVGEDEKLIITRADEDGAVHVEGIGTIGSEEEYPYFKSLEDSDKCLMEINGKTYRGNVEIRSFSDSDMTVINHLSMQEYLYGVVPGEIGHAAPLEAFKAQAIIARTYAANNYGKRAGWGFDLYPTTSDQYYNGYSEEEELAIVAVDETYGQVAIYDGELISANYYSTSGGYTENSENVWVSEVPYLRAVPDYYEPELKGYTTWEVTYTADEIRKMLADKAYDIHVGDILDLEVTERTEAGRVLELKIIGTKGEATLTKSAVRTCFGLKSQWYTINDDAPEVLETDDIILPGENNSRDETGDESTNDEWWMNDGSEDDEVEEEYIVITPNYSNDIDKVTVKDKPEEMKPLLKKIVESILNKPEVETKDIKYEAAKSNSTFVFRGRGFGHGVGMSQNGAKGMANAGFTYEEIITWYFTGVEIVG